ncbi:MAG: cytochrome c3 family protein [Polyangiaceae bacterium]
MARSVSTWFLCAASTAALLTAALLEPPSARAQTAAASAPSSASSASTAAPASSASRRSPTLSASTTSGPRPIRGLAPLPGNAKVPLADRPPGAFADDHGPSPVVFPPQKITIRFNHRKHVRELGVPCTACHDQARTSRSSKDRLLPSPERCDGCHGSDHRDLTSVASEADELASQCAFCHIGYKPGDGNRVARFELPTPNLRMNHAAHVARNIGCAQCHGNVENLELATRDQLPRMRGCFSCHQMVGPAQGQAHGECRTCHLTDPGGRMKTEFASGKMVPPRWLHDAGHSADWIERHKQVAGNDSKMCATCHTERSCTDCHDGRVRPRKVHPNDWISMHPMAARQNNPSCTSCHKQQSFCLSCHQRSGVTLSGPYENFAGRGRFHPPKRDWTDPPRSGRHHSWEAQRNLNACVSCHVERECATCHATARVGGRGAGSGFGGQGANPHPMNFRDRCRGALKRNARPCLVCHDPADPQLQECR